MIPIAFFRHGICICFYTYIKNENLVLFFNNNDNENFSFFFLWEMGKVQRQRNDKINFLRGEFTFHLCGTLNYNKDFFLFFCKNEY